tara:strand:+ start:485 stop:904 length:420 start_codon:yes stop_codon:yes gene_type:complete
VQNILEGMPQGKAAAAAGYAEGSARVTATRLMRNAEVVAALGAARADIAARGELSREQWNRQVLELVELCKAAKQYGMALRGYELLGRSHGYLVDSRTRAGSNDGKKSLSEALAAVQVNIHSEAPVTMEPAEAAEVLKP